MLVVGATAPERALGRGADGHASGVRPGANEFTKLALRHPLGSAAGSAAVLLVLLLAVYRLPLVAASAIAVCFAIVQWFLWRPGGPASRHEGPPPDEVIDWTKIAGFAAVCVVLTLAVVITYAVAG